MSKKISLGFILSLFLFFSCGSRKVNAEKTDDLEVRKTEQITRDSIREEAIKDAEVEKREAVVEQAERSVQNKEEEKQDKERVKTSKREEYYPNGQLKLKDETTERESEKVYRQRLELEYLRSSMEAIAEERNKLKEALKRSEIKQDSLKSVQVHQVKKEAKETEREWSFLGYLIIFGGGFFIAYVVGSFMDKKSW